MLNRIRAAITLIEDNRAALSLGMLDASHLKGLIVKGYTRSTEHNRAYHAIWAVAEMVRSQALYWDNQNGVRYSGGQISIPVGGMRYQSANNLHLLFAELAHIALGND